MSFHCEHCSKGFRKESTLATHMCEQRRRWEDRNTVVGQLALEAYRRFYQRCQPSSRPKTWQDFAGSRYYTAFRKFAQYTLDVRCVNTTAYLDHLLKQQTPLDRWCQDAVYEAFMLSWTRTESVWDAVERSLITAADWAEHNDSAVGHYFRYATDSRIISDIVRGRMSAWLIYASTDGVSWLQQLMPEQQQMIYDWIDPDHWQRQLAEEPQIAAVRKMLEQLGMNS